MKEVTDPTLLDQLNAKEVTDPKLLSLLNEGKPPEQPGLLSQIASGAWQGAKNLASGVVGLATLPATAPFQVVKDVMALGEDPAGTLQRKGQEVAAFAKGMIPMRETGMALLSGQAPSPETVSRETTEAAGGYALGKYAIPGAVATGKKIMRSLPGASVELNEVAAGKIRQLPDTIRPAPGVTQGLYASLKGMSAPNVAMTKTQQVIADLLAKEGSLAAPDKSFVKLLRNFERKTSTGLSFQDLQNNAVDLGEKIGQIQANKGTRLGEMKDLLAAIHEDAATAVPAGGAGANPALQAKSQVWDQARLSARRGFAANELQSMIEKGGISTVGDGFTQVNTNAIVTKIEDLMKLAGQDKRARLFVESFQPGELQGIVDTLKGIGKTAPKVPVKAGTPVGSSQRWLEAGIGGLAGSAVGGIAGHPGLGATVGGLTGPIASHLIAKAMMTETGRALVRRALSPTGQITPQGAALLGAFIKAQGEQP